MLLGLTGPKKDALAILKKIKITISKRLSLQIHTEKSDIKHYSDGISFLGYKLLGNRIKFSVSIKKLVKKYTKKGLLQIAKKGRPIKHVAKRMDKMLFLPNDVTVVKKFNTIT